MHLVPAPAVRLIQRQDSSRPGVYSLMSRIWREKRLVVEKHLPYNHSHHPGNSCSVNSWHVSWNNSQKSIFGNLYKHYIYLNSISLGGASIVKDFPLYTLPGCYLWWKKARPGSSKRFGNLSTAWPNDGLPYGGPCFFSLRLNLYKNAGFIILFTSIFTF